MRPGSSAARRGKSPAIWNCCSPDIAPPGSNIATPQSSSASTSTISTGRHPLHRHRLRRLQRRNGPGRLCQTGGQDPSARPGAYQHAPGRGRQSRSPDPLPGGRSDPGHRQGPVQLSPGHRLPAPGDAAEKHPADQGLPRVMHLCSAATMQKDGPQNTPNTRKQRINEDLAVCWDCHHWVKMLRSFKPGPDPVASRVSRVSRATQLNG